MFLFSKFKFIFLALFVTVLLATLSFSTETTYQKKSKRFQKYISEFNTAVICLDEVANDYKLGRTDADSLKLAVKNARTQYKKVEFYLSFYYNEYVNTHINGAPLIHIERTGTLPAVVQPEGLQVLDELVYSDEIYQERSEISSLATKLRASYSILHENLQSKAISDGGEIFAMQMELVRIFTLGLTGFDTPGSLNVLQEAEVALQSMKGFLQDELKENKNKDLMLSVELFEEAIRYLNSSNSFEDFDRLVFLKEYLDPLYQQLGKLQKIEDKPEFLSYSSGWNPQSISIFSEDFLDPYYFSELEEKDDNNELKALGKTLFYDPLLSGDQKISCASCHNPEKAFTDGQPKSLSNVQGKTVLRNAPTLINSVYADRYFYDLRAFTLEQQAEHVIFNQDEFNTAYSEILKKLKEDKHYVEQFRKVFGKNKINRGNVSKALASYVLSLNSFNSEFDKYVRGETPQLDTKVKNGFNLFMGKANCATCHFAPTFSGLVPPFYSESESEILGVLDNPDAQNINLDSDEGRLANQVTSEEAWIYQKSFKTTTVRNAALTAPYFHNGAYQTLEEVIEFYNQGGGAGMGLTVTNQTLPPDPLNLSDKEKEELIAFLQSLTDNPFIAPN